MPRSNLYWQMPAFLDTGQDGPDYDLMSHEDYLTYRVAMLAGEFNRNITRYFARYYDLTFAEGRVLARLINSGPLSYGEICDKLLLDGAQISRAAAALVDRGFLRKGADPKDARRAIFELTEEGRRIGQEVLDVGRARQKYLLEKLTSGERKTLYKSLSKLMQVMTDLNDDGILLGEAAMQEMSLEK